LFKPFFEESAFFPVIGNRRWAFTPAYVAATGWDEGIYLKLLYGRTSLDG